MSDYLKAKMKRKLREAASTLDFSCDQMREETIDKGFSHLKSTIGEMYVTPQPPPTKKVEHTPRFERGELAEVAIDVYKNNIKPDNKVEIKKPEDTTPGIEADIRALSKSLVNIRNGGDTGRNSPPAGPNGGNTGTVGAINYYALSTSMSMEEYEVHIQKKFGLVEEEDLDPLQEPDQELLVEDGSAVKELEKALLQLEDHSWQAIDKVMRGIASDYNITPKELHKAFKSAHGGKIPDDWVKEQIEEEVCGWLPLEEATIMKNGMVYEVSMIWKGQTHRLKFFWPEMKIPTRNEMVKASNGFYPGSKLLAYYPAEVEQDDNYMVLVPPLTESYTYVHHDAWVLMSEEENQVYEMIAEEQGEPVMPPMIQDDGSVLLLVEDHDTGEQLEITYSEGSLHDWFGKSKSKSGKPGWVQSDGSPCANEKGETKTPKCYSSQRLAGLKKTSEGKKKIKSADARKSKQDSGQQSKSGGAKPTMVRTFTDKKDYKKHSSGDGKSKNEEVVYEAKDSKGSGSGSKDACYNKVKSRYKVWPSAYASGALVKCRQKGADNWGNSSKKEEVEYVDEACWKGYTQKGMKTMFGKKYPNCVKKTKKEEVEYVDENAGLGGNRRAHGAPVQQKVTANQAAQIRANSPAARKKSAEDSYKSAGESSYKAAMDKGMSPAEAQTRRKAAERKAQRMAMREDYIEEDDMKGMSQKSGDKRSTESGAGMTAQGVAKYRSRNPGSKLSTAVTTPPSKLKAGSKAAGRRKSFCARSRGWDGERGKAARKRWNC